MLVTTLDSSYNSGIKWSVITVHAAVNKLQILDLERQEVSRILSYDRHRITEFKGQANAIDSKQK